jgi:hypothetical protein
MPLAGCSPSVKPSESKDAGKPMGASVKKCRRCTVKITPNPLELYVSEPDEKLRTLTAVASPAGGTFKWTSSDPSKLTISGTGSTVTVQGLDEGDVTVRVDYSPPTCPACFDEATVQVRYEGRHILVAQGIQFNNAQLASESGIDRSGDEQIPTGYLTDQLGAAVPFPIQVSGTSATFKSVKQGVKYTIDVTTSRTEFKNQLETPGKPGTKELEYWHVIYDGHSRYGRGACFGTDESPGEDWENSSDPAAGPAGLYRMAYPFVGVPVLDILHHEYSTDVVSVKVNPAPADREYKGKLHERTLKQLKQGTESYIRDLIRKKIFKDYTETELNEYLARLGSLDSWLRIVGDRVPMVSLGDALRPDDKFWAYHSGEGPAVLLQAGWKETVTKPMDLGATDLKCRIFCHFGCSAYQHYRSILRDRKNWKKSGNTDWFAYFTHGLSVSITGPFWLYYLLTYDQFSAGKPWEPSLEYARIKTNARIAIWCGEYNKTHRTDPVTPYKIW